MFSTVLDDSYFIMRIPFSAVCQFLFFDLFINIDININLHESEKQIFPEN